VAKAAFSMKKPFFHRQICPKFKEESLYKYKIIESPKCTCEGGDQPVDRILFDFRLLEHDRVRLKAVVTRSEKWPVSRDKLSIKFYKYFKEFTNNIKLDKV
jgi:hypothetical protein